MPNEGKIKCRWCGEFFDEGDVSIERSIGPICEQCIAAIKSRGERVTLTDFDDDEYEEWKKKHEGGVR